MMGGGGGNTDNGQVTSSRIEPRSTYCVVMLYCVNRKALRTCQRRSATLFAYNKSSTVLQPAHGSSQLHDRIEFEHGHGLTGVTHGRIIA